MSLTAVFMALVCVICYSGQNIFNKLFSTRYSGPASAAVPVFSIIYGLVTGIATLASNRFVFAPSGQTVILGLLCGFTLFIFNFALINASRTGPYALQSLLMLFGNTLLPLLFSVLFWRERLSITQLCGIAMMLIAFAVFNSSGFNLSSTKKGYFRWVTILFFSNGLYGIFMDAQQKLMEQTQRAEMIAITFLFSALISAGQLVCTQGAGSVKVFRMGRRNWTFALLSSLCAALAINTLMICLRIVPASVLYTVNNGGVLILCALFGVVAFREKLNKSMIAGIMIAVIGLVLLSL